MSVVIKHLKATSATGDMRARHAETPQQCFGNCKQGRSACTLPGVCGPRLVAMADGAAPTSVPLEPRAPAPAEACTELGAHDEERDESPFGDTPGSARATRRFWLGCAAIAVTLLLAALSACGGGGPDDADRAAIDPPACTTDRQVCQ